MGSGRAEARTLPAIGEGHVLDIATRFGLPNFTHQYPSSVGFALPRDLNPTLSTSISAPFVGTFNAILPRSHYSFRCSSFQGMLTIRIRFWHSIRSRVLRIVAR
jgi:hypothetical protein